MLRNWGNIHRHKFGREQKCQQRAATRDAYRVANQMRMAARRALESVKARRVLNCELSVLLSSVSVIVIRIALLILTSPSLSFLTLPHQTWQPSAGWDQEWFPRPHRQHPCHLQSSGQKWGCSRFNLFPRPRLVWSCVLWYWVVSRWR